MVEGEKVDSGPPVPAESANAPHADTPNRTKPKTRVTRKPVLNAVPRWRESDWGKRTNLTLFGLPNLSKIASILAPDKFFFPNK